MVDPVSAAKIRLIGKAIDGIFSGAVGAVSKAAVRWRNENAKSRLATKLASFQKVKTFWQRDKAVDLKSFYYPSKVIYGNALPTPVESIASITLD